MGSADDVAQDVCMTVISALPHYQLKGTSFRSFVYGIAAHKVTDALRAIGRNRTEPVADLPDGPAAGDGPERRAVAAELSERLGVLLGHLTSRQREVLVLRVAVGLSAEETAEAVGLTPGAVRVTQHRALNQLRRILMSETEAQMLDDPASRDPSPDEFEAVRVDDPELDARAAQARTVQRQLGRLTNRERVILERLAGGQRARSISEEFGVSLATVRTQIRSMLRKLDVASQLEAVALLNEHRQRPEQEVRRQPSVYDDEPRTTPIAATRDDPARRKVLSVARSSRSGSSRADITARSAITGRFVTAAPAARHPRTTVTSTGGSSAAETTHRSAITGRYVSAPTAVRHPRTTVTENG